MEDGGWESEMCRENKRLTGRAMKHLLYLVGSPALNVLVLLISTYFIVALLFRAFRVSPTAGSCVRSSGNYLYDT